MNRFGDDARDDDDDARVDACLRSRPAVNGSRPSAARDGGGGGGFAGRSQAGHGRPAGSSHAAGVLRRRLLPPQQAAALAAPAHRNQPANGSRPSAAREGGRGVARSSHAARGQLTDNSHGARGQRARSRSPATWADPAATRARTQLDGSCYTCQGRWRRRAVAAMPDKALRGSKAKSSARVVEKKKQEQKKKEKKKGGAAATASAKKKGGAAAAAGAKAKARALAARPPGRCDNDASTGKKKYWCGSCTTCKKWWRLFEAQGKCVPSWKEFNGMWAAERVWHAGKAHSPDILWARGSADGRRGLA